MSPGWRKNWGKAFSRPCWEPCAGLRASEPLRGGTWVHMSCSSGLLWAGSFCNCWFKLSSILGWQVKAAEHTWKLLPSLALSDRRRIVLCGRGIPRRQESFAQWKGPECRHMPGSLFQTSCGESTKIMPLKNLVSQQRSQPESLVLEKTSFKMSCKRLLGYVLGWGQAGC